MYGKVIASAGNLPLSEWATLIKDQAEDLVVLINAHEATPTDNTKQAVHASLDRIDSLVRAAYRHLRRNQGGPA